MWKDLGNGKCNWSLLMVACSVEPKSYSCWDGAVRVDAYTMEFIEGEFIRA